MYEDNQNELEDEAENTDEETEELTFDESGHIGKKLRRLVSKLFIRTGLVGVKAAALLGLIILKILGGIWFVITDIFESGVSVLKKVLHYFKGEAAKKTEKTNLLQKNLREAKKLDGKEKNVHIFKSVASYLFGADGMFHTAVNYILPIASVIFFLGVLKYGSGLEYGICVEYNGKQIGVITDESDLDTATREVQQRIAGVDGLEMNINPKMSLKIVSDDEQYYNSVQLANRLLSESNKELADAYGIYIDEEFIGAVKDKAPVENALTDILVNYKTEGNIRDIGFKNKVEYRYGTYLAESVMTENDAIAMLTATNKTKTTYVAQKGDSAEVICQKFGMETEDFYNLNPNAADTIEKGTLLNVTENESYLPIQYIRDLETRSYIDYATVEIETSSLNVGAREIIVKGERGEKRNTVEATYVDGIERSRTVISSEIIKEPVVEQVGVGTYQAKPLGSSMVLYGSGEMGWPVDGGYVSDTFISDRNHKGMDIAAPAGTNIYAAKDGMVESAGWNPGGYGYFVLINHGDGYETVYGHCSALFVTQGQMVTRGQLIAAVGSTGDSTGNHCHFEVRYFGICYDPAAFINTAYYGDAKKDEDDG